MCHGQLYLCAASLASTPQSRRGEKQRGKDKNEAGERDRMGGVRGEEEGKEEQLCVREAQLGNEKCDPPPHTTTLRSHIRRSHTHTHTHTIPISLSSPQERKGGGGCSGEGAG